MYDQVVKWQRAGLCLSEHFLIQVVLLPAEAQSGRMTRKRVADSDKTKDATKDTTVPGAVKNKPRKANPRTLKHEVVE